MDRLGNTLGEIAADKAGIIKPGVPVISNVDAPEAARVIAKAAYEQGSRLYDVSKIKFEISEQTPFSQKVSMELYGTDYSDVTTTMTGRHQGENLKTALAVIEVLRKERKIKVERSRLYEGLKKAVQPGRFEVLSGDESNPPVIIIDGAHNEAGAGALQETVNKYFAGKRILLITGMLADKQVEEILKHFVKITEDIIITEPDNPRKLSVDKLDGKLKEMGISPIKASDAAEAVSKARSIWNDYEAVVFAGSLYLIGDVRRVIKNG